jgi:hypothetical protein
VSGRFQFGASNSYSQATQLLYRQMAEVGVTSSTVYACNGQHYIYAMGNTYSPVGGLGTVEPVQEEAEPFPRTVRVTLRAVNSMDFYEPMREDMFGRRLVLRHVLLHPSSYTPVSTPETLWSGYINKVGINYNQADKGTYIEIEAETDLRRRPPVINYNKESMLLISSGDTFFNYIDQVQLATAHWGKSATTFSGGGGGGRGGGSLPPGYSQP